MDPRYCRRGAARSLPASSFAVVLRSPAVGASSCTYHDEFLGSVMAVEAARRLEGKTGWHSTDPSSRTRTSPPAPQRSARPSSATATSMKRPAEGRRMLTIKLNCPARTTDKNGASQPSRPPAPTPGRLPRNGQPNLAPARRGRRQKSGAKNPRARLAPARCQALPPGAAARRADATKAASALLSHPARVRANPPLFERPTARRLTSSPRNRSPSSRRPSPCSTRTAMARSRRRSSAR